jgi:hypothetical protein
MFAAASPNLPTADPAVIRVLSSDDREVGRVRDTVAANADRFAHDLAPVLEAIRTEGHVTLRAIAAQLNAKGMLTRRGGQWQVSNVKGVLARLARGHKSPSYQ